ncbi:MAG: NAD-dependent epimerase/dehydratase family protein [Bacteroidia bacterium]|nr:NAD-dependent epimerase/dehydratase family protein [Bacteroidia bacterium]
MTHILVTGASGFIGSRLTEALRAAGAGVWALSSADGDIAGPEPFAGLEDRGIRHVFHLAARSFVPDSWADPAPFYRTNVQGTAQVLELCRRSGASLTFLSTYLYGAPQQLPIPEDHPLQPSNPYAHSKLLAEELCAFYARCFGVPVTVLRLFNVYGPGQRPPFLIPHLLHAVLHEPVIRVQDLAPRRDFVHVADVLDALLRTMEAPRAGMRCYNIGSGRSHSVGELIDALQAAAGVQKPVESAGERRPNEILDTCADISRARAELGWAPAVSLDAGLRSLIAAGSD